MARKVNFWSRVWLYPYNGKGCWLWIGPVHSRGYGAHGSVLAHRKAYEDLVGPIPEKHDLDHTCHVRLCVNPSHLRVTTRKQNMENHQGARKDSKTGVRGVYWEGRVNRYRAQVRTNGIQVHIGYFKDLGDAEVAVREARNIYFTHNDVDKKEEI